MKRTRFITALIGLFSLAVGCRGCEKGPDHILGLVDASSAVVAHVPDVEALRQGVDGFATRATRKAGPKLIKTLREKMIEQLGFDPLGIQDWSKVGVNAAAGAVVFTEGEAPEPVLAFGVSDRTTFDEALKKLIRKLDGANQHRTREHDGRRIDTVGRPFGDELVPVLHWAHLGRYALVVKDAGLPSLEAALSRLAKQEAGAPLSLQADTTYQELAKKVPPGELRILFRQKASQMLGGGAIPIGGDSITSLRIAPTGLSADTFVPFPDEALVQVFAGEPTLPLAARVPQDAVLVAMTRSLNADSVAALHKVGAIGTALERSRSRLAGQTGIDPEKEAIPNFAGPLTASIHLHDLDSLPARLRSRSLAAALESIHVAITAELKDPVAMLAILERSRLALSERGTAIRRRELKVGEQSATLFEPDRDQPRFGWGVVGGTYVYAAGRGRLALLLDAVAAADSKLPEALGGTVGGVAAQRQGTSVVILRSGALADAVASADFGGVLTNLIGSLLELVRTIGDVALAVSAEEGGMRLELREQLQ